MAHTKEGLIATSIREERIQSETRGLPDEIWEIIAHQLDPKDYANLRKTGRSLHALLPNKPVVRFEKYREFWVHFREERIFDQIDQLNKWDHEYDGVARRRIFQTQISLHSFDCHQDAFDFLVDEKLSIHALELIRQAAKTNFALLDPASNDNYAFIEACKVNDKELIEKLLLAKSVNPNAGADDRQSGLYHAILKSYHDLIIRLLQDPRVDPTADGSFDYIQIATLLGQHQTVELFLKDSRIDPSLFVHPIFEAAVASRNVELLELLLKDPRIQMTEENQTALSLAVERGQEEMVKLLLQDGRLNPSTCSNNILIISICSGYDSIFEMLLQDSRIDPSVNDNEPIKMAAAHGQCNFVSLLLKHRKVNPCAENNQALKNAAEFGNLETIAVLLKDIRVKKCLDEKCRIELSELAREGGFFNVVDLFKKRALPIP